MHEELVDMEEMICPFCNEKIGKQTIKKETL